MCSRRTRSRPPLAINLYRLNITSRGCAGQPDATNGSRHRQGINQSSKRWSVLLRMLDMYGYAGPRFSLALFRTFALKTPLLSLMGICRSHCFRHSTAHIARSGFAFMALGANRSQVIWMVLRQSFDPGAARHRDRHLNNFPGRATGERAVDSDFAVRSTDTHRNHADPAASGGCRNICSRKTRRRGKSRFGPSQ